jgi:hypothetical protein
MFRPNWPSSGVQAVVVKDFAAQYNAVFFHLTVVAVVILIMWVTISFYMGVLGLHVIDFAFVWLVDCSALIVLAEAGVLLCVGRPSYKIKSNNV